MPGGAEMLLHDAKKWLADTPEKDILCRNADEEVKEAVFQGGNCHNVSFTAGTC
jgi:hypothetical protein